MIKTNQIITLVVLIVLVIVLGTAVGMSKSKNRGVDYDTNMPPISEDVTPAPGGNQPKAGEVTLTGKGLCLPHRDTTGPQTLECAMGFQDEHGNNYGLSDVDPNYTHIMTIGSEGRFEIHGTFTPKQDEKYNSIGIITVDRVTAK